MSDQSAGRPDAEIAADTDDEQPARRTATLDKTFGERPARGGHRAEHTGVAVGGGAPASSKTGRFWSTRRLPAAILSAVLVAGIGLLLYDIVEVRLDRPGMLWRRVLADELSTRPLDDLWVRIGAALAALAGIWLLALALTPGMRGLLPLQRPIPDVRAGLERTAAALVLRDRAMQVPGIRTVRVDVKRRKVKARAEGHFRSLEELHQDLDAVLREGIRKLGLARPPRLSLRVRRAAKK